MCWRWGFTRPSDGLTAVIDDDVFTYDGVEYTVTSILSAGTQDLIFGTTPDLPLGNGLALHVQRVVGEVDLPLSETRRQSDGDWYFVGAMFCVRRRWGHLR